MISILSRDTFNYAGLLINLSCWLVIGCCLLLVAGCSLLVACCWLLVAGWLLKK